MEPNNIIILLIISYGIGCAIGCVITQIILRFKYKPSGILIIDLIDAMNDQPIQMELHEKIEDVIGKDSVTLLVATHK